MQHPVNRADRFQLLSAADFRCQYCGQGAPDVILEIDHVLPRALGGKTVPENLIVSCFDCNRGKRDRLAFPPPRLPVARYESVVRIVDDAQCEHVSDCCPDCADYKLAVRPVIAVRHRECYELRYRCPDGHTWMTLLDADVLEAVREPEIDMPYWPKVR